MNRMAGLALTGAGLGAAGLGVAAATGNLPVSKQQQLEELKAQGITPTPEQEKEARDEQLAMLGAAALTIGAGTAAGAGSDWVWSALDPVGSKSALDPAESKADAAILRRLSAVSPHVVPEVQAILDRKAGKAPPLRVEATPLESEQRFAASPEVVQQVAFARTPLLGSRGQRLTRDPAALEASLRRIGEVFERGDIDWDQQLPTDREMTPAQVRARELRSVGEAISRVSPQWLGELVDALGDGRSYREDDPQILRLFGQHKDYMQAVHNALEASAYTPSLSEAERLLAPSFFPNSFSPVQVLNAEDYEEVQSRRRPLNLVGLHNWRFDDNAPVGVKGDLNFDGHMLMNSVFNHFDPRISEDDRILARALGVATELNYTDRMSQAEAGALLSALRAQDLDGWLDLQAYRVHHAGQHWQEPQIPAAWQSPEFYAGAPSRNARLEEVVHAGRHQAADLHAEALERTGARGFRERLRSGRL